jgi:predicted ATPase
MKIGFIGTGGTGKTSTIKQLGDLGLPLLESVSRAVFKEWGWKEEDQRNATPELVWKFQKTIFDRKLLQEEGLEHFFSDRTLLDHLTYCFLRAGRGVAERAAREMLVLTKNNLATYDFLFFFPNGLFDPGDDGMREQDYVYGVLADATMQGLLNRFGQSYLTVPMGTVEERADFIRNCVKASTKDRR